MKVPFSSGNVTESAGVQTTSGFNIARTPHMFNILSSGLYSDKVAAVLREISCNAMDAHIMGGTPDKPFQVKLPTSLDRTFYVKDWGPGLNDKEVRELYTTYGWSSKQQNDDVTGAFGLGSKSPFAYTAQNEEDSDGFTIVAVKDGVKRIYTCHLGEGGAPAISRLHEGPADADWQHGVMVTFPVQSRDIDEFHQKAVEVFQWFRVTPEVLGLKGRLKKPKFQFNGSFFAMKPEDSDADRAPCVVTGNVRYPINAKRLGELSPTEAALLNSNMVMFLPIGEVMMTPSREELQYTEQTKSNLRRYLARASTEVAAQVCKDVMTPEATKWAWFRKIQTYVNTLPSGVHFALQHFLAQAGLGKEESDQVMATVKESTVKLPTWAGDGISGPLPKYARDEHGVVQRDEDGEYVLAPGQDLRGARVWLYIRGERGVTRREVLHGKIRTGKEPSPVAVSFLSDVTVFYQDAKLADQRVRALVRDHVVSTAFLVVPCKGSDAAFAQAYAERLTGKEGVDGLPLAPVSSLPVPSSVETERERRRLAREQGPRFLFSGEEVVYVDMAGVMARTTLGELDETDLFYATCTKMEKLRRGHVRNRVGDQTLSFSGYYLDEVMNEVRVLVGELGLPITGFILVPSESAARRMKFEEQGIRPFLGFVRDELAKNADKWESLHATVDRTPTADLTEAWRADDYGWLGILGHQAVKNTPFWNLFTATYPDSPLLADTLEFVANTNAAHDSVTPPMLKCVNELIQRICGMGLSLYDCSRQSSYEVANQFYEKAPTFKLLSLNDMLNTMKSDPEKALQVLHMAMTLEGLVSPKDKGSLQLAA